jgi:copper chaperone
METLKFKTNIKCSGCLSKVTPTLNEVAGEDNWDVNINEPNKTLTVEAQGLSKEQIIDAVQKAGYTAEAL